jgi:2-oxoglutarate/2-oxoacid ferredoxin oxidoreductase subunit beta
MTTTYRPAEPIWCAGCGHFGVQSSLQRALETLRIEPSQTLVVAGIGCSGTIQNNLGTYGYHALHGRALPTAIGAHLADPRLTVVAAGGDGDGYAIGMGHLVHAFRRNPSIVYVVMHNGVYGLTKGQPSPTAADGTMSGPPLDAVTIGLALPATTFVARGFARRSEQLDRLALAALEHARARRGFAFLEVLSPCVHYNDTYPVWDSTLFDVDADPTYDRHDRATAFRVAVEQEALGRMVTGLLFEAATEPADQPAGNDGKDPAPHLPCPAAEDLDPRRHENAYRGILDGYLT